MKDRLRYFVLAYFMLWVMISSVAQIPLALDSIEYEDTDSLRQGFIMFETSDENYIKTDSDTFVEYDFIRYAANVIQLNGDDWTELQKKYASTDRGQFSIVHAGDSHLQADIMTGEIRRRMQGKHGDAGRGLIVPFKLAGTNEPLDYRFAINRRFTSSKVMKRPWKTEMDFSGVGLSPSVHSFELTFDTEPRGESLFMFARIYHAGELAITDVTDRDGRKIGFTLDRQNEDPYTDIFLDRSVSCANVSCYAPSTVTLHGVMLSKERNGLFYHVIGNNGACYSTYNAVPGFGRDVETLYPDLIIVSLGTNEAFGKFNSEDFYASIDKFVSELRFNSPDAKILLTTPKECQRRVRKGRGRSRTTTYQIVENCRLVRDVIVRYARDHSVALYDWFEVSGGEGISSEWVSNSLLSRDRVHNTETGYLLAADLFHSALERALTNP